jgi:DNA repair protein RecO (recombination protein O)
MSAEKTEGLVVRVADFSETSRVVTLFTRDFGRISALAKGGRKLKGPFEAALDLLARCRIVFLRKSSSSLDLLTEAQLVSRFRPAGRDLVGLYGGYYVAELLTSLTEEYDPHPGLYDEAIAAIDELSAGTDPRRVVVRFGLVTLREIGELPQLDACLVCGNPPADERGFAFWASQGGLLCPNCQRDEFQSKRIPAGTIAVARKLSEGPHEQSQRLVASPQQLREIQQLAVTAISGILGHRPKMTRYLPF